jgi:hypothetical protein
MFSLVCLEGLGETSLAEPGHVDRRVGWFWSMAESTRSAQTERFQGKLSTTAGTEA